MLNEKEGIFPPFFIFAKKKHETICNVPDFSGFSFTGG